jgi:bifunctional non-homologous end joining protein LigD
MKALLVDQLPKGPQWLYEVKFDGFRALAIKDGDKVLLRSRNSKDLAARYPQVLEALRNLPARQAVLDGEIVAVDPEGRSSFQLLQSYQTPDGPKPALFYYVFDLLNLDGRWLLRLPLSQRKELLKELVRKAPRIIRFSASLEADSAEVFQELKAHGLEGLIAKLKDSPYESDRRSGAWAKFKWSNEQEFVIGGYTPPKRSRPFFGAILVGYHEGQELLFASKVGSGFNTRVLAELHERFQALARKTCPFANLPEKIPGGLTAGEMRACTWVEPELVCQVRFTEWTRDHHLRHPLFLGLREDKVAREVVRETAGG